MRTIGGKPKHLQATRHSNRASHIETGGKNVGGRKKSEINRGVI